MDVGRSRPPLLEASTPSGSLPGGEWVPDRFSHRMILLLSTHCLLVLPH